MKNNLVALSLIASLSSASALAATNYANNVVDVKFSGLISTSTCDFELTADGLPVPEVDFGLVDGSTVTAAGDLFGTGVAVELTPGTRCSSITTFTNGADIKVWSITDQVDNTNSVLTDLSLNDSAGVSITLGASSGGEKIVGQGFKEVSSTNGGLDTITGAIKLFAQPYANKATLTPGEFGATMRVQVAYK